MPLEDKYSISPTPNIYVLLGIGAVIISVNIYMYRSISREAIVAASILLAVILGTRLIVEFSARAVHMLQITREFLDPLIEDSSVRVKLTIYNKSIFPVLNAQINDHYPGFFKLIKGSNKISASILPRSRIEYEYTVRTRLGKHVFKNVEIIARDPLNIFNYKTEIKAEKSVVKVKPRPTMLSRKAVTIWTRRGLGMGKARMKGLGQEFYELREYVPGDDYRFIDWKSYARLRKLYVKEFEREANLSIIFVIDASKDAMRGVLGETPLEYMARITAGLSEILLKRGDWVGVVVRGSEIIRSGHGHGVIHRSRILNALANISWEPTEPPMGLHELLYLEASKITKRTKTLFFVLTTLMNEEEAQKLVPNIKKLISMGHIVYIVQLIPELFETKKLSGVSAAIYTGLTYEKYLASRKIREYLMKNGVKIVSVGPHDIRKMIYSLIESHRAVIV